MLVGLAAGVLAFAFAFIFGEPQVQRAIDFEATFSHDPEVVSRGLQRTLGLLTGTVVMGVALGGLFSLAFAYAYGRLSTLNARATSALLALAAFLTITAIPFTKYPANPPTVGNPDTIDKRTMLFLAMIAITVLAAIAARRIRRDLLQRTSAWNAALLALAGFVAIVAVAQLILPAVHETPPGFPADVLYRFRLASLGISLTLWTTIGLGFGAVAERLIAARQHALTTAPKQVRGLTH
jgi:glucan phosphoethanolaminetransferase (alkaline phosphatase superfamily)